MKLTWLHEEFPIVLVIEEQAQQHVRAYILHLISTEFFPDYFTYKVYIRWLPLLEDFDICGDLSWGGMVQIVLYRSLYKVFMMRTSQFSGHSALLQVYKIVIWINYSILLI